MLAGSSAGAAVMSAHMLTGEADLEAVRPGATELAEIGVGIDEGTAVLFRKGTIEVIGRSQVMVIDARRASTEVAEPDRPHAARGLGVHILREGMVPWPIALVEPASKL